MFQSISTRGLRFAQALSRRADGGLRTSSVLLATRRVSSLSPCAAGLLALGLITSSSTGSAQLVLPVEIPGTQLPVGAPLVYTIDLDSLPARPRLIVDITPDAAHPDLEIEVEVANFRPYTGSGFSTCQSDPYFASGPTVGALHFEADLYECGPRLTNWDGVDADVRISLLDPGAAGLPLTADLSIRAITQVPTNTVFRQVAGPQSVTVRAYKDTVLYSFDPFNGNGRGQSLWSGTRVTPNPFVPFGFYYDPWHSLLAFPLDPVLPSTAVVTNVELDLFSTGVLQIGGGVSVHAVAGSTATGSWVEGSEDAPGDESVGSPATNRANWLQRGFSSLDWTTPGGDTTTSSPLATNLITSTGPHTFSSPGLVDAVQDMVTNDRFSDGFRLSGPQGGFSNVGVQFASNQHPDEFLRPELTVDFTPSSPAWETNVDPNVVDFVDEGDDFRWIYDTDEDGILTTPVGGVCEVLDDFDGNFTYPYTYSWSGAPGFVGVDCCTWWITSTESATLGAGQELFFHNLDPLDVANIPPDSDGDGILDTCDNCVTTPNGPGLGICFDGTATGATCESDLECSTGETCQKGQQDADRDGVGDACPEPGFGLGASLGALALGLLRRRERPEQRVSEAPACRN